MKGILINRIAETKTISRTMLFVACNLLLLMTIGMHAKAQGPYPKTGDQVVCLNGTEPYGVVLNNGSKYSWSITTIDGGNGTIAAGATPNLVSVHWTGTGRATLSVTETNAQGCVGDPVSINVTVNSAPAVTVNSSSICTGTTATITATPGIAGSYTYKWTVPAGVTDPGNVSSFTSKVAGTYSVIITTAGGNCSSVSASGTVTISAAPSLVTHNPSVCGASSADLTAASVTAGSTAGMVFTYWKDASATVPYSTPTAATPGTYYIKGALAAGCSAIQPITVTVGTGPTLVVTNPAAACAPATVDLTAASVAAGSSSGLTLSYWTNAAATTPYATPKTATAGTYYIKGTLAGGCSAIKAVVVRINPAVSPLVLGPDPVCISTGGNTSTYSVTNTAGHQYNWTITGGTITTGQNTNQVAVVWSAAGTGNVGLTETVSATGCSGKATKAITITPAPATSPITHN